MLVPFVKRITRKAEPLLEFPSEGGGKRGCFLSQQRGRESSYSVNGARIQISTEERKYPIAKEKKERGKHAVPIAS